MYRIVRSICKTKKEKKLWYIRKNNKQKTRQINNGIMTLFTKNIIILLQYEL